MALAKLSLAATFLLSFVSASVATNVATLSRRLFNAASVVTEQNVTPARRDDFVFAHKKFHFFALTP